MAMQDVRNIGGKNQVVTPEWFVARITEVGASQTGSGTCIGYPHGWIEQSVCKNAIGYEDAPVESADTGTLTDSDNLAYMIGGGQATVDDLVLMRIKAIDTDGKTVYEFQTKGGGGGGGTGYVTSVQCTGGYLIVSYD